MGYNEASKETRTYLHRYCHHRLNAGQTRYLAAAILGSALPHQMLAICEISETGYGKVAYHQRVDYLTG